MTGAVLLVFGLALLLAGGTLLVRGASALAESAGVSPLAVGLTVVAFGTSTPELVVNIVGALRGATDIAFGNVVGSNISNLGLILGTAALMRPIRIESQLVRREIPLLLLATAVITVMALDAPLEGVRAHIGRSEALVLFLLFGIFIYISVLDMLRSRTSSDVLFAEISRSDIAPRPRQQALAWAFVVGGCAMLFVGGELTVEHGVALAAALDVSEAIIGLFLVAVGTSLPELVTSIIAARRGESDLAVGNVIGSNIFNSLAVLPASAVITEVPVSVAGIGDLVFSLVLAAALIPVFLFRRARLGRSTGALLVAVYIGYAVIRIAGGEQ